MEAIVIIKFTDNTIQQLDNVYDIGTNNINRTGDTNFKSLYLTFYYKDENGSSVQANFLYDTVKYFTFLNNLNNNIGGIK